MSNQALSELIQRFAISALSRERKAEALNEEILVGKYSGEFYIKTKEGIVLSADIMNRAKELLIHLDLDEYNILNGDPQLIHSNGNVKILIEIIEDGITRYVRVDKDLSSINFNRIPLELKGKVSSIKIMNITIGKDANIGANNTILLHNLFVTINH